MLIFEQMSFGKRQTGKSREKEMHYLLRRSENLGDFCFKNLPSVGRCMFPLMSSKGRNRKCSFKKRFLLKIVSLEEIVP